MRKLLFIFFAFPISFCLGQSDSIKPNIEKTFNKNAAGISWVDISQVGVQYYRFIGQKNHFAIQGRISVSYSGENLSEIVTNIILSEGV